MASIKKLPAAIQWHEGMLLAPQHFQQAAVRQDALLEYHTRTIAPFHWGVRHLEIDRNLLVDGTFRVEKLEAVLPDGLIVSHGPGDDTELEVALDSQKSEQLISTVFLALAKRSGSPPVRGRRQRTAELARYRSVEGNLVSDENTGDGALRIPRLLPRIRLILSEELPQKYVGFPLAKVIYANETFALTDYVPPTLQVTVASPLGQICNSVARRLREKATSLSEQARSPSIAVRAPQLQSQKNLIHSLVAALPSLEAVLRTEVSHPYALYVALCSVVGHVAAVGKGLVPPALDPYSHADPRSSFEQAASFIDQCLSEGIVESFAAYPFRWEEGAFLLDFDPAWMKRALVLGVRHREGFSEKSAIEWIDGCLIGSTSKIPSMEERRILGAERKKTEADSDLVPSRGVILYALTADPAFIAPGDTLEIRNRSDEGGRGTRPIEMVLWVRNEPGGEE